MTMLNFFNIKLLRFCNRENLKVKFFNVSDEFYAPVFKAVEATGTPETLANLCGFISRKIFNIFHNNRDRIQKIWHLTKFIKNFINS